MTREVEVRPCASSTSTVDVPDPSRLPKRQRAMVTDGVLATGCDADTTGNWTAGHDARAVGVLKQDYRLGLTVHVGDDSGAASEIAEAHWPTLAGKVTYVPAPRKDRGREAKVKIKGKTHDARVDCQGRAHVDGQVFEPGTWLPAS